MAFAARALRDRENPVLDLNAGCPVPKIVKNGEGSALLKSPDIFYDVCGGYGKKTRASLLP